MTRVSLGIDLGTSGVKTVLLDEAGTAVGGASRSYPVAATRPGWAETDPALWEQAARDAVGETLAAAPGAEVLSVGLDGQMHGTVLVDDAGAAVRPAVLWPDARAADQLPRWRALPDALRVALGNPLTAGMPGPVLGWLAEHEPETLARADSFVLPKDWLRSRLVPGTPCTDGSDASATLLWDVSADAWAVEAAERVGVPVRLLPPLRAADETAGTVGSAVAAEWGLPAGIPVSIGCGDVAATLLGLGAEAHRTVLTVGTGAQLVLPGVRPEPADPVRHQLYRDAEDGWFAMGAVMNGGLALGRVIELLGADWDDLYRSYDTTAALPGFLPWFAGERLPEGIEAGTAGWFDVGLGTTRADLLASALEGVAFTVRRALEAMPPSAEVVDLVGGGTRSPVFNQLLADVLHRPLRRLGQRDATVLGAARLGWRTAGRDPEPPPGGSTELVEPRTSEHLDARYARFLRHPAAP
ncbi:MAG: Xylulokinase [Marmoricola sp.]|nr:Xylulokinase [Marmoricola sp.]